MAIVIKPEGSIKGDIIAMGMKSGKKKKFSILGQLYTHF